MKFRQWMGRLVSKKSFGPGVLDFEGSCGEDCSCGKNCSCGEDLSDEMFLPAV